MYISTMLLLASTPTRKLMLMLKIWRNSCMAIPILWVPWHTLAMFLDVFGHLPDSKAHRLNGVRIPWKQLGRRCCSSWAHPPRTTKWFLGSHHFDPAHGVIPDLGKPMKCHVKSTCKKKYWSYEVAKFTFLEQKVRWRVKIDIKIHKR